MRGVVLKKILSFTLVSALTLGVMGSLSGCGKKEDTQTATTNQGQTTRGSKYEKFITVDVYDSLANYQGIQSGWFAQIVRDKFNMELNIIAPNVAGNGDTLYQTRTAAGDLGDLIITGTSGGSFQELIDGGLVLNMAEYLKDKEIVTNFGTAIEKFNGKDPATEIYGIPSEISIRSPRLPADGLEPLVSPYVKWDAYKAAGYPEANTLEDMVDVLKKMQEAQPESDSGKKTYGISLFKDWDGNMMCTTKNFASLYGYDEMGFALWKVDGTDFQDIIDSDGIYVRCLKFLYDCNQAGLVDPESTSQNYDILSNKFKDGQILMSTWNYQSGSVYNSDEKKAEGKGYMPMYIKDSSCLTNGCYSEGNGNLCIAIGSKAEDPERLADFIDWLYSSEGVETAGASNGAAGPEDLTWKMEYGRAVLTEFGEKVFAGEDVNVPEEWGGGNWTEGVSTLNFKTVSFVDIDPKTNEPYLTTMWSSILEKNTTALDNDWKDYSNGAQTTLQYLRKNKALSVQIGTRYTQPEESTEISTIRNQCKEIIVDNSWKMIFAKDESEFNSLLKDMQDKVKGLGYDDVIKIDIQNAKDKSEAAKETIANFVALHKDNPVYANRVDNTADSKKKK
ncbi:MAG: ABC transporter substrate-binding protein [Lachnospiraceae bacterium]|nr:ABC transporter substrate-binding protein [Lachnospiraceae bacterium]